MRPSRTSKANASRHEQRRHVEVAAVPGRQERHRLEHVPRRRRIHWRSSTGPPGGSCGSSRSGGGGNSAVSLPASGPHYPVTFSSVGEGPQGASCGPPAREARSSAMSPGGPRRALDAQRRTGAAGSRDGVPLTSGAVRPMWLGSNATYSSAPASARSSDSAPLPADQDDQRERQGQEVILEALPRCITGPVHEEPVLAVYEEDRPQHDGCDTGRRHPTEQADEEGDTPPAARPPRRAPLRAPADPAGSSTPPSPRTPHRRTIPGPSGRREET